MYFAAEKACLADWSNNSRQKCPVRLLRGRRFLRGRLCDINPFVRVGGLLRELGSDFETPLTLLTAESTAVLSVSEVNVATLCAQFL